jgi:U2 small nuclear ribonucleoprotein A'
LLLSNNAISRIDSSFFSPRQLPLLHTLLLTNNRILDFSDLEPLSVFAEQLAHLSLLDNPVTKKAHYRLWVLSRLPRLRSLDFKRVRPSEVAEAQRMFPEGEGAKTFEPGEALKSGSTEKRLTAEQVAKVKAAIKAAKTLAEINRLERILQTGYIPDSNEMAFLKNSE